MCFIVDTAPDVMYHRREPQKTKVGRNQAVSPGRQPGQLAGDLDDAVFVIDGTESAMDPSPQRVVFGGSCLAELQHRAHLYAHGLRSAEPPTPFMKLVLTRFSRPRANIPPIKYGSFIKIGCSFDLRS